MARTARKVRSLVAEDPEMADALSAVLSEADDADTDGAEAADGDGRPASDGGSTHTVAWGDVSDDLTSGQWGRLIQTGILTDRDGEGFAVGDPEGVREGLSESEEEGDDEEGSGWTTYDKLAALAAISLVPAYFISDLTNAVGGTMNLFIGPIHDVLPFYAVVVVLSVFTGLYSALLMSNLMNMSDGPDQEAQQERMKEIREDIEDAKDRDDDAAVQRLQKEQMELMGESLGMFKQMFRSMVWVMLITIPVFIWMYWMIGVRGASGELPEHAGMVLPLLGELEWTSPAIGPLRTWILWYMLCSIGFRQVIQKSLDLRTNPAT